MKPLAVAIAALMLAGVAHGQSAADLKKKIVVEQSANGVKVASSSKAAEIVRNERFANGGKGSTSVFVYAQKAPGLATRVSLIAVENRALFETEVQGWMKLKADDGVGYVGTPWRKVPFKTLEYKADCPSSGTWCMGTSNLQMVLSADDVRAILQEDAAKVRVSLNEFIATWSLSKAHLVATLDALGVTNEFAPPGQAQ